MASIAPDGKSNSIVVPHSSGPAVTSRSVIEDGEFPASTGSLLPLPTTSGPTEASPTASGITSGIAMTNFYGPFVHPVLRDQPTGQPILSGKQRHPAYKRKVASFEMKATAANALKDKVETMLSWVDKNGKLSAREKWDLAANIQFLIVKETGMTPPSDQVDMVLVREENETRFRTDIKVKDNVVIQGKWEMGYENVLKGLKDGVDEIVYGPRQGYMG